MARQSQTAELPIVIREPLGDWQRPHASADQVVNALYQICNSIPLAAREGESLGCDDLSSEGDHA
jgi:hypothetical protein